MFRLSRTNVIAWTAVVTVIAALSYALTGVAVPLAAAEDKAKAALVEFTADGKLKQPVGYRKWVYVGTPLTPNDMNDGEASFPEFHEVYMDPESFAHYEKTGEFRDGTVLVKELSSVGSKKAPSGKPSAAWPQRQSSPGWQPSACRSRYPRMTRRPPRPATSRRTSPRTAGFPCRLITGRSSCTWARMPWPRSRTSRSTRCTTSTRDRKTSRRTAGTASSPTVPSW